VASTRPDAGPCRSCPTSTPPGRARSITGARSVGRARPGGRRRRG
jgi:hypothetical protein